MTTATLAAKIHDSKITTEVLIRHLTHDHLSLVLSVTYPSVTTRQMAAVALAHQGVTIHTLKH